MKDFETISEYQILNIVYVFLLERVSIEEDRNEIFKKQFCRDNEICQNRLIQFNKQIAELESRILKLERKRNESDLIIL